MTEVPKEIPQEDLQETMISSFQSLVRENARLAQVVDGYVQRGLVSKSSDQVVAALRMTQAFSEAARIILEGHGSTIFPDSQPAVEVLPQKEAPSIVAAPVVGEIAAPPIEADEDLKPTTFAQLLRQKIKRLIPKDKEEFKVADIQYLLNYQGRRNLPGVARALGFNPAGQFSKDQVLELITKYLVTPTNPNFKQRAAYNRDDLFQRFKTNAPQLDGWSVQIGYDWSKNPTVDFEQARQIRGLVYFERFHPSLQP